ncbi:hypothetical protein FB451DRAFT_1197500 [Mycena latifolia]|nr:hypothetical protein FB451DRAFT_1197500 [Mycena latifolia]
MKRGQCYTLRFSHTDWYSTGTGKRNFQKSGYLETPGTSLGIVKLVETNFTVGLGVIASFVGSGWNQLLYIGLISWPYSNAPLHRGHWIGRGTLRPNSHTRIGRMCGVCKTTSAQQTGDTGRGQDKDYCALRKKHHDHHLSPRAVAPGTVRAVAALRCNCVSDSLGGATATYLHPKSLMSALQVDMAPRQGLIAAATATMHRRWREDDWWWWWWWYGRKGSDQLTESAPTVVIAELGQC